MGIRKYKPTSAGRRNASVSDFAELTPGDLNHTFFASGGSDANDTNVRLVRHYWAAKGKPEKKVKDQVQVPPKMAA